MLRTLIGIAAIVFVGFALALTITTSGGGWPMLAGALLVASGCLYERRYHAGRSGQAPEARFRATGERFVDPESGRDITVWTDPATGERRYVEQAEPRAPPG